MPDSLEIRKITSLRQVGIFNDYRHNADVPELKRHNLFYGFNGTGKTTISRILRALDAGEEVPMLSKDASFELALSDGRSVTRDKNADALIGRILVFNHDFIDDNLRWSQGQLNPIFYIGKESSRLVERLNRIERGVLIREEKARAAAADLSAKKRSLETFYTDTARIIAATLGLGRQYHAGRLKQDYGTDFSSYRLLNEEEFDDRKKLLVQDTAYDLLSPPKFEVNAIRDAFEKARITCDSTITEVTLSELQDHPSMAKWLKDGYDYHSNSELTSCLFCGNDLPTERLAALQSALGKGFESFFGGIEVSISEVEGVIESLRQLIPALPSTRSVSATLARKYEEALTDLRSEHSAIFALIDSAKHALYGKTSSPIVSQWPEELRDRKAISNAIDRFDVALKNVLALLEQHNLEQNDFARRQEDIRAELKFSLIIEYSSTHVDLVRALTNAEAINESRRALCEGLKERANQIRDQIRDHGPAIERINNLLFSYLGHEEIQLESFEEGYRLLRYGKVLTGPLSEGERTAIAICYFLSKLEEQGRNLSNQIVVIDDPVSSLDAGSLNYAFNLLKNKLQDAQQIIILTHSLPFMNETKKWLRKAREKSEAAFIYIRSWHDKNLNRRRATLVEMPKLLRGYDSEYHYLFSLVRTCAIEGADSERIPGYIMPNVVRRVLELFLAFKVPGSEGLGDKINRPIVQNAGLELARLQALNRLAQVESHSDNLDNFIGFSSMTIEETQQAAEAVMKLIEALDTNHYARCCELAA